MLQLCSIVNGKNFQFNITFIYKQQQVSFLLKEVKKLKLSEDYLDRPEGRKDCFISQ